MAISIARAARQCLRWAKQRPTSAPFEAVQQAELAFYNSELHPSMIVFDVGANIGELTLLFSRLVAEGHVHAFEAGGANFQRLVDRCKVFDLQNVALNHVALAEREATVQLQVYDDEHSSWNTLARRPLHRYGINVKPVGTEYVQATTVDVYCERHGIDRIDLLKIDVEGAEYQVLLGARRMFQERRIHCCTFEFGQATFDMGNHPADIERYMLDLGYHVRNILDGDPPFPGRESAAVARHSMHVARLA